VPINRSGALTGIQSPGGRRHRLYRLYRLGDLSLSRQKRHLLLLAVLQTGCLAAGLWVHYRSVLALMSEAAQQEAWSEQAAHDPRLLGVAGRIDVSQADPQGQSHLGDLSEHEGPGGDRFLVTDGGWRVLSATPAPDNRSSSLTVGSGLAWTRDPLVAGSSYPVRGVLRLADGLHAASAYPLQDGRGYLVAHRAVSDVKIKPVSIESMLFSTTGIAFIWISGLVGLAAYVVGTRFFDYVSAGQRRSQETAWKQTQQLVRTRDAVIFGLAKLAESRDPETGDHLDRISLYSSALASALRLRSEYQAEITPAFIRNIEISSVLHDIGKVGIDDTILRKPGTLTRDERWRMQTHTTIGADCLKKIDQRLGGSSFLQMAVEIALNHHERWDGNGYPGHLAGSEIPLSARIVAVADVYDALITKRVYKESFTHDQCVSVICEGAGKHFDPAVVDAFLQIQHRFREIARRHDPIQNATICLDAEAAAGQSAAPAEVLPIAVSAVRNP
jgi:HD-GYP domain-containing protein (c-di-GMP phosphodiesterase class II)